MSRRRYRRIQCHAEVVLDARGQATLGRIVDESEGGVALAMLKDTCDLRLGEGVEICFQGGLRRGTVRNILEFPEGMRVGIAWDAGTATQL